MILNGRVMDSILFSLALEFITVNKYLQVPKKFILLSLLTNWIHNMRANPHSNCSYYLIPDNLECSSVIIAFEK